MSALKEKHALLPTPTPPPGYPRVPLEGLYTFAMKIAAALLVLLVAANIPHTFSDQEKTRTRAPDGYGCVSTRLAIRCSGCRLRDKISECVVLIVCLVIQHAARCRCLFENAVESVIDSMKLKCVRRRLIGNVRHS